MVRSEVHVRLRLFRKRALEGGKERGTDVQLTYSVSPASMKESAGDAANFSVTPFAWEHRRMRAHGTAMGDSSGSGYNWFFLLTEPQACNLHAVTSSSSTSSSIEPDDFFIFRQRDA